MTQYHPDKTNNDEAAATRFKAISDACVSPAPFLAPVSRA